MACTVQRECISKLRYHAQRKSDLLSVDQGIRVTASILNSSEVSNCGISLIGRHGETTAAPDTVAGGTWILALW